MAVAAETTGTLTSVVAALQTTQAQISQAQSAVLPNSNMPVVPWKVGINGAATYNAQDIMGTFAGGTYYPYPTNNGVISQNSPAGYSGGLAQYWPDQGVLNQQNVIFNQANLLYRIYVHFISRHQ